MKKGGCAESKAEAALMWKSEEEKKSEDEKEEDDDEEDGRLGRRLGALFTFGDRRIDFPAIA